MTFVYALTCIDVNLKMLEEMASSDAYWLLHDEQYRKWHWLINITCVG